MSRAIYLYNTSSRLKELFKPIHEGHVGIYVCGPTVYGDAHLGHARPGITYDVLVRLPRKHGWSSWSRWRWFSTTPSATKRL